MLAATAPLAYVDRHDRLARRAFCRGGDRARSVGLFVYAIARDYPPGRAVRRRARRCGKICRSCRGLRVRSFVCRVFAMQFSGFSIFVTVLGLWAGPYLAHVYGYDLGGRGELLFLLATPTHLVANAVWGPARSNFPQLQNVRRDRRERNGRMRSSGSRWSESRVDCPACLVRRVRNFRQPTRR